MRGLLGAHHGKFIRVDDKFVVGSTNFTRSSQCNRETAVEIHLNASGVERVTAHFLELWSDSDAVSRD